MTDQRRILGFKLAVLYFVLVFAIVLFKTAGPDLLIWPESAPHLVRLAAERMTPEKDNVPLFKMDKSDMLIWSEAQSEKTSQENYTASTLKSHSRSRSSESKTQGHFTLSSQGNYTLRSSNNDTSRSSQSHQSENKTQGSNGTLLASKNDAASQPHQNNYNAEDIEPVVGRLGSHNNNNENGTRLSPSSLSGETSAADLAMAGKLQLNKSKNHKGGDNNNNSRPKYKTNAESKARLHYYNPSSNSAGMEPALERLDFYKTSKNKKEGNNNTLPSSNNTVTASHSHSTNYNSNNSSGAGMKPSMERLGSSNKIGTRFSSFTTSGEFPDAYPTLSDRQRQEMNMTTLVKSNNMNQGNTTKKQGIIHRRRRPGVVNTTGWRLRTQNIAQGNNTLPNFFLAGTAKAGTTAIAAHIATLDYSCLGQDNANTRDYKNYVNGTNIKETHFFDRTKQWNLGPQYFLDLYRHCPNETTSTTTSRNNNNNTPPLIMEATPANLAYADRIYEIYKLYGDVQKLKIVISLREPVSREISNYAHMVRDLTLGRPNFPNWIRIVKFRLRNPDNTTKSFAEWSQFIRGEVKYGVSLSLYATHLKRWFELFDRQQILLIWYDDFKENNARELARIHEFLGVPPPPTQRGAPHVNDKKVPMDAISCTDQGKLHKLFRKHDKELFALIAANPGPPMEHKRVPGYQYNCSEP